MYPYRKLLFPTDFSQGSRQALEHAIRLTDFQHGEVIVQHVVNDYFQTAPHWITLFDVRELQLQLDTFANQEMAVMLSKISSDISIRSVTSKGKTAEEIVARAEKESVDLIVMGAASGNITNSVIRTTNCPVLAVSSNSHSMPSDMKEVRHILVATDFSDHSRKVVRHAFELKKHCGASIHLLYVIETTAAIEFALKQSHYSDAYERMTEWAMNQLLNLIPDDSLNDPNTFRIVKQGNATDCITSVAREAQADLVVLGVHEYGIMHRHLWRTVADKVLSRLETPLLTVRV